jgi:hypothetical protein
MLACATTWAAIVAVSCGTGSLVAAVLTYRWNRRR